MIARNNDYETLSLPARIWLRAGSAVFELAGMGPNEVFPRQGIELASCDADIVVEVGSEQFVWPVRLPSPTVPFDNVIRTEPRGEMRRSKIELQ